MTDRLQATLAALASPIRREILWMLGDNELPAGRIAAALSLTAGTISSHLSTLLHAGLVSVRREGNFRFYRADREALAAVLPLLAHSEDRWAPADDIPERDLAAADVHQVVEVSVQVSVSPEVAYEAFVDPAQFSAWLGVPVTIDEGRFATEMEWGTRIRGTYEVLAPPHLIALRWDFEDDETPVPGGELPGYVRFHSRGQGCRVEVHQLAGDAQEAEFMNAAWSMVLGRYKLYADQHRRLARDRRPKHRG